MRSLIFEMVYVYVTWIVGFVLKVLQCMKTALYTIGKWWGTVCKNGKILEAFEEIEVTFSMGYTVMTVIIYSNFFPGRWKDFDVGERTLRIWKFELK